ncbi:MAG: hypothetical protein JWM59_184 [Verrucomicrobiales bacterium]|nr:hypothetical protein [Verrucomicrobiales bacterium]
MPAKPAPDSPAAPPASMIDAKTLMSLGSLELRARAVVEGFRSGLHRSPYHGFSVEFTEYRQYTPGDDPRHLDWRVYARSDRYYIQKFEDETNLRCHLLVDQSRSMAYGSPGWSKAAYAATMAATLARFLHLQGDAVGLLCFDEGLRDYLPARNRTGHLRQLMLALDKPAGGGDTNLIRPLTRTAEMIRKRGLMVMISDFLTPLAELERALLQLTSAGNEFVIFQVLDPAEQEFGFSTPAVFEDVESRRTLFIDPAAAREGYLKKFQAHQAELEGICHKLGIVRHVASTVRPLEQALTEFFQDRLHRGRLVRRTPARRSA